MGAPSATSIDRPDRSTDRPARAVAAVLALALVVTATLLPGAAADHLGIGSEATCTETRETVTAGGLVEAFVLGEPFLFCHIHAECDPDASPDECAFEFTIEVDGTGVIEAWVEDDESGTRVTCGPAAGGCTAALTETAPHDAHLNCGVETTTNAVDVSMTCTVRWLPGA